MHRYDIAPAVGEVVLIRQAFDLEQALLRSFSFKAFADFGLPPLPPGVDIA